jgi:hypothetical protein
MATVVRMTAATRIKAGKTVAAIEAALKNKADADARLEIHQDRQRQAHALRQLGLLGDDETVLARRWLDIAFGAAPSLARWAGSKLIDGRKPSAVQLKELLVQWLCQPVNAKTRGEVYTAMLERSV